MGKRVLSRDLGQGEAHIFVDFDKEGTVTQAVIDDGAEAVHLSPKGIQSLRKVLKEFDDG